MRNAFFLIPLKLLVVMFTVASSVAAIDYITAINTMGEVYSIGVVTGVESVQRTRDHFVKGGILCLRALADKYGPRRLARQ